MRTPILETERIILRPPRVTDAETMFNNWCTDTEASRAMLGFAIQRLLEARFFGRHAKENPASGRVMKKLGFVYQKDGTYSSFDGARTFDCKEYILEANRITSQGTGLLR